MKRIIALFPFIVLSCVLTFAQNADVILQAKKPLATVSRTGAEERRWSKPDIFVLNEKQRSVLLENLSKAPGQREGRSLRGSSVWEGNGAVDAAETRIVNGGNDKTTSVFDYDSGKKVGELSIPTRNVALVRFHPTQPLIYTVADDNATIARWSGETFKKTNEFSLHPGAKIQAFDIAPNGSFGVSGGNDKKIVCWNLDTGKVLDVLEGHADHLSCLAVHPSGKIIASADWGKTFALWKVGDKKPFVVKKQVSKNPIHRLAFSPDGSKIVVVPKGSSEYVTVFDVKTGDPWRLVGGYGKAILSAAFSPDGSRLATGDNDSLLIIWDLATRKPLFKQKLEQGKNLWNVFWGPKHENTVLVFSGYQPAFCTFPAPVE